MDKSEDQQTEWPCSQPSVKPTWEEGETEVSAEAEGGEGTLLREGEVESGAPEGSIEHVATCPNCHVADSGEAIVSDQNTYAELAFDEEWASHPFWALLRDAGYERL